MTHFSNNLSLGFKMELNHVSLLVMLCLAVQRSLSEILLRQKRIWIIDSFAIDEGYDGPFPYTLGRISVEENLSLFRIHGQGVDEEPQNTLEINELTGDVSVLRPVDYEKFKILKLTFQAIDMKKQEMHTQLGVIVDITDSNDNPPKFEMKHYIISIKESTVQGTGVISFKATDDDTEKDNRNVSFSIISVTPKPHDLEFFLKQTQVDQQSYVGTLSFKGCLDHEKAERYTIIVEARDKGKPKPLSSSCTITVNIEDGNNHPPVITEHTGPGKVKEREENVLVSRLKVTDEDARGTEAWRVKYQIHEDTNNNFRITTDPETNEGLLYVDKQLNYEDNPVKNLTITVENEIPYFSCKVVDRSTLIHSGLWKIETVVVPETVVTRSSSYQLTVTVEDVNEPPVFDKPIQHVSVNENVKEGMYLITFSARDPDISSVNTIKYMKGEDPADWVTVDPDTGKISTSKVIDRESAFVKDGVYVITVYAVDDGKPPVTGTATLSIQIRDENDNRPYLVVRTIDICQSDEPSMVNITVLDLDDEPYGGPFTFNLLGNVQDMWRIDPVHGYSVNLVKDSRVHSGHYELELEVFDLQGEMAVQNLSVTVCTCLDPTRPNCKMLKATASVGGQALGATFICAVLLAGLLLFTLLASCKKQPILIPINKGHLMLNNTESLGTDCSVPLKPSEIGQTPVKDLHVPIPAATVNIPPPTFGYSNLRQGMNQAKNIYLYNSQQSMRGASSAMWMRQQQEKSYESKDEQWNMDASSAMWMRQQQEKSYESQGEQWNMDASSAMWMRQQQEKPYEFKDQQWKIIAASSAMGMQQEISTEEYFRGQNQLEVMLKTLGAPGNVLGDYEPHLYADEGDFDHTYELDAISISEVPFEPDLKLDNRFSTLASICMPSDITAYNTTSSRSSEQEIAVGLIAPLQLSYQESQHWTLERS